MAQGSTIEWTESTWNPIVGCSKVSAGCKHCLVPETPVLYADMTWRPIGEVKAGDKLVGFDEQLHLGHNRAIREAVVQKAWRSVQPSIRLRIGQREVITTADHQWLCEPRPWWRTTTRLRLGVRVRVFGNPVLNPDESPEYMAGYVAGMTLGDGTFRFDPTWRSDKLGYPQMYWRVAVADQEILERLESFLAVMGVTVHIRPFSQGNGSRKAIWKVEIRAKANLQVIADMCRERDSANWRAGWLGGMFDAEGSHDRNLRISQKDVAVLEQGAKYAAALGIPSRVERFNGHTSTLRVEGGAQEKAHFLSATRPVLQRKINDLLGRRLDASLDEVTAIERLGEREVVDIQTSTGTFIAAGICTHNCYAERLAKRLGAMAKGSQAVGSNPGRTANYLRVINNRGRWNGKLIFDDGAVEEPLKWKQPRVIFVNSMSDLFHEDAPLDFIKRVFSVMNRCPQHTFQVLTKRPEIAVEYSRYLEWTPNIWMGTSVEDAIVTHRIKDLRRISAKVRFLSVEPLLGPIPRLALTGIHWVIVGGESGPGARPMEKHWVTQIRDRCIAQNVPFFFKQWGGVNKKAAGRTLEGKTWDQMPKPNSGGSDERASIASA